MSGIKTTSVFANNLHAYVERTPIIVNQGGTRSSKSYSIMQLLLQIAMSSSKPLIISVVSYALPHLKLGVMRDFDRILVDYGINVAAVKNIADSTYKLNGSVIEFFGVENLAKVHGPERDILFINECNFVKYEVFEQLLIRTRKTVFLDFNPSREFWYHGDDFKKLPSITLKSTYRDNEFLTRNQVTFIESKKQNAKWWKVYGEGELGQLEGAVFDGWRYGDFDEGLQSILYGQDFGFSNDPTTLIRVGVDTKKKIMYWDEAHYSTGLLKSTKSIADVDLAHAGKRLIVGDSAEKRLIYELKNEHHVNIRECLSESKKSVAARLLRLLDYEHVVTERSSNIAKEMNYYTWIDKKGQLVIDDFNHAIDAGGYAFDYITVGTQRHGKSRIHVPRG